MATRRKQHTQNEKNNNRKEELYKSRGARGAKRVDPEPISSRFRLNLNVTCKAIAIRLCESDDWRQLDVYYFIVLVCFFFSSSFTFFFLSIITPANCENKIIPLICIFKSKIYLFCFQKKIHRLYLDNVHICGSCLTSLGLYPLIKCVYSANNTLKYDTIESSFCNFFYGKNLSDVRPSNFENDQ